MQMGQDISLQQLGRVQQIKGTGEREALLIECLRRIGRTVAPTRLEHPDLTVVFGLVGNALLALGIVYEIPELIAYTDVNEAQKEN
jgi:hypothetical protein